MGSENRKREEGKLKKRGHAFREKEEDGGESEGFKKAAWGKHDG